MKMTILLLFIALHTAFAQEIKISENLFATKLSEHVYVHTCENSNGIIYIHKKEAIIVSTPDSDIETQNLIDWTKKNFQAKIIAFVIDRWHPDAMEGLDIVQKMGIPSYAYELTRSIAKTKGLPVPKIGFDPKIELSVGGEKLICHFLGAAHTGDGIVVWIPKEQILFGGNEIRNNKGWVGNIGDANLEAWSATIERVKKEYGSAKIVVPGHGKSGGAELIDYTIELYKPHPWGEILRQHDIQPQAIFNDYGNFFEIAKADSTNGEIRYLLDATVFANDTNRYFKITAPHIIHDVPNKKISSGFGRLQIFSKSAVSDKPTVDLYYKQLILFREEDEVGYRVVLKEMVR